MKGRYFSSFRDFTRRFRVCFGTDAFDTDTFQRAILYQNEGYPLSVDLIILCIG